MNVRELINILEKMDDEAEVVIDNPRFEGELLSIDVAEDLAWKEPYECLYRSNKGTIKVVIIS